MSRGLTRTDSLRKHIRPIVDIEEEDDDQRRDSSGRKRVDVVQCLLDSSSDENDDENINIEKANPILWLTFNEICHIRYVLAQTNLSLDKQSSEIRSGSLCFRCRRKMNQFSFLPSFFRSSNHEICFICQQMICKKCSYSNFQLPSGKLSIPIRIQTLIKPSSMTMNHKKEKNKDSTTKTKPICYDCLQVKFKSSNFSVENSITDIQ
jgi:hypothetical protein